MRWLTVAAREGSWAFVMQYYPVFERLHQRSEFIGLLKDVGLGPFGSAGPAGRSWNHRAAT